MDDSDAELFAAHADELTRFATGLVGPADAEDVVTGAFLRCWTSSRWPSVENRRAYLYRAVLNEARSLHRGRRRRVARERSVAPREALPEAATPHDLDGALDVLSLRQRSVIVLTYWGDLDPASIATLLNISDGSVRQHLARGRARLREVLDDDR
ncbi:MAG TPA: RNA polymerase sigma factor [Acidimicrobiales bacterium]|nr:RNA polymerase sigma factor [Acidimicrobiales bacterium]